ncbi:Outer membrane receptor proteins, mostly Fe transport [Chryseobacterium formosense]|uniref:TonB-dependent receptor domain-containing protein n=1 Tax=Chryseobacterium formosense TaxID=236814 RepID=UPI00068ACAC5|nr:TonB-dependent receptor [Chryseobacterium formosense]SFT62573.1 Outer membrane receptor proteins, mostly Fe transport [Chryseobacterium formosense]
MNFRKLSIAALFLTTSGTLMYAQEKNDTVKNEKKIEGVIIQGTTKKGSESNIISIQKKSVEVIERVGSVQLEKQGVGDVSVAVTKATGSQKQEGSGQIFIRGLGDRNNSTTINGLQVPSNDPLYKNIDLSIIKTDMIDFIGLEKVYNPKLWGDMSGANVDIVTKVYTGKPYFKVNLGSSVNFNAVQKNNFFLQDGPSYFGFTKINQPSKNSIVNQGYVFKTSWKNQETNNPFNSSLSFDFGTNFKIGEQGKLSIFGYGGFDNSYDYFKGTTGGSYDGQDNPLRIYDNAEEYRYTTNTTGVVNVNYKINSNHNINLSSNYIHTSEQKLGNYSGYNRDYYDNDPSQERFITQQRRATYRINDLISNQLRGEHTLSEPLKISWNIGFNRLDSKRPDRQDNVTIFDKQQNYSFFASSNPGANNRYYDQLLENDFVGDIHADYKIGDAKITLGYSGRYKDSDFKATQYNFRILPAQGTYFVDPNNYDTFFNLGNYQTGAYFDIVTFRGDIKYSPETALVPQTFTSEMTNNAGYVNVDYKFSEKFTAQLGVRYENLMQKLTYNTAILQGKENRDYNKILPAFNLKYSLNDKHNLRLAGSKTYTTPLLLETAPFEYVDVDESTIGNVSNYPADNYNVDLKWEWFPKKNELISLTAFGKYIQNPLARVTINSSSNSVSFMNVGDTGRVFGLEAEFRKDIYTTGNTRIYTFMNGTYLNTEQDLDTEKVAKENQGSGFSASFIKDKDKLQGASEFLANANVGLEQKWGNKNTMDFVVSYSYISDNIYALGFQNRGNMVDKAFSTLDATLKFKLGNGIGFSFTGRNLLNPYFTRIQDNPLTGNELISKKYKRGTGVGASVSYEF